MLHFAQHCFYFYSFWLTLGNVPCPTWCERPFPFCAALEVRNRGFFSTSYRSMKLLKEILPVGNGEERLVWSTVGFFRGLDPAPSSPASCSQQWIASRFPKTSQCVLPLPYQVFRQKPVSRPIQQRTKYKRMFFFEIFCHCECVYPLSNESQYRKRGHSQTC